MIKPFSILLILPFLIFILKRMKRIPIIQDRQPQGHIYCSMQYMHFLRPCRSCGFRAYMDAMFSSSWTACLERWVSFSFVLIVTLTLSFSVQAENNTSSEAEIKKADVKEEKSWWQKRQHRSDIFYPHKPHMDIMKSDGDACMLCHPFSKNNVHDEKTLKPLAQINNEPLEAICHDCHVEKMNAPSECELCHPDPSTVWPQDHNYDYKNHHTEDAQADQDGCSECHKQLSFCTDCHFKRTITGSNVHRLGYKSMHGLDARIAPAECGSCHQARYCSDCHRRSK